MGEIEGKAEELKGKAREKYGDLTGDEEQKIKGKAEELKGKAEQAGDKLEEEIQETEHRAID